MIHSSLLTSNHLKQSIEMDLKCSREVSIVSAYITDSAMNWLFEHLPHKNLKLLGRFIPEDFLIGASDLSALAQAIAKGYTVYMHPQLHAKIYYIDQNIIYTGSANLTAKGLSLCSVSNLEAATKLPYTSHNHLFIEKLFRSAKLITSEDLFRMQQYLESNNSTDTKLNLLDWENIFNKITELFVADLPK